MKNSQKENIANEIALRFPAYDAKKHKGVYSGPFQSTAAKIAGVSDAQISNIVNGKWDNISLAMWRNVAIKLLITSDWQTVETSTYTKLYKHLEAAQRESMAFMVSAKAGIGKSETYKAFTKKYRNVIYVEYATFWKTKTFVKALCSAAGLDDMGTVEDMVNKIVWEVNGLDFPIIIIDQFDKMKDSTADLFIDLFNMLPNCAFCISGTPALEKKMKRGLNLDKTGYHEIWSRSGGKVIKLEDHSKNDVELICKGNGLFDEEKIEEIYTNAKSDGRVIKKEVKKYFLNNAGKRN